MLNLPLKEMRLIVKIRNMDDYISMSKNQSINLITTNKLSPTPRPAFKIEEYIAKLSKIESKDFMYYNYGFLSSKTKDEVYQVLNKCKVSSLKKYVIGKYHKQNKPTSIRESTKRSEPVKW